jgi:hypothetical protein
MEGSEAELLESELFGHENWTTSLDLEQVRLVSGEVITFLDACEKEGIDFGTALQVFGSGSQKSEVERRVIWISNSNRSKEKRDGDRQSSWIQREIPRVA